MLELTLKKFTEEDEATSKLLLEFSTNLAMSDHRKAAEFLLQSVGIRLSIVKNDSYYKDYYYYTKALIESCFGDPNSAVESMKNSGILPFSGGDILFEAAQQDGLRIAREQEEAIARGMPSILISSMPRSASASITSSIASALKIPVARLSIGKFPEYYLINTWLWRFRMGGMITHDHFSSNAHNIKTLLDSSVDKIYILYRNPIAATISSLRMRKQPFDKYDILRIFNEFYLPWINGWIKVSEDYVNRINVRFISSKKLLSSAKHMHEFCNEFLFDAAANKFGFLKKEIAINKRNYSGEKEDKWMEFVDAETLQIMNNLMSDKLKGLLNYEM